MALFLSSQLSAISGYSNAATAAGTTIGIAQSLLTQLGDSGSAVEQAVTEQGAFALNNTGQTSTQASASTELDQILSLLNTQVGGNYLFSGSAVNQPSVASMNEILNGNGAQAGLTQVISERTQADLGTGNTGRLTVGGSGSNVTLSQDGSPFGFQLASVNSTLTGATVSGPTGSPPTISVGLGSIRIPATRSSLISRCRTARARRSVCRQLRICRPGRTVHHRRQCGCHCRQPSDALQALLPLWRKPLCQRRLPLPPPIISSVRIHRFGSAVRRRHPCRWCRRPRIPYSGTPAAPAARRRGRPRRRRSAPRRQSPTACKPMSRR